ncbi:hypothetical protein ACLB2K_007508 [Fragaria x ananassa]
MAPQVTVFFHKLPATAAHPNRAGHRMSFVIGHVPVACTKAKLEVKQDKLSVSTGKTQTFKTASKNALRNRRKRVARAQRKINAQAKAMKDILAEIAKEEVICCFQATYLLGYQVICCF